MNFKEQSQLVTVLRDKFKEPISDDVIKELFDKKNEIAASDVDTSLEFDDFFVEVIVSWIGTDLTSQKANLLIELINSDNGAQVFLKTLKNNKQDERGEQAKSMAEEEGIYFY